MQRKQHTPKIARYLALAVCGILFPLYALNTLSLEIDSAKATINRSLYGVLMENYGRDIYQVGLGPGIYVTTTSPIPNTSGMRNDIIAGLKDAGISAIEWPGGCFADKYNWRQGIAEPQSSRPGGESTNGMGTPEYFKLCQLTGAQGYIAANVQSDSAAGMAAWLTYIDTMSAHPEWKGLLKYLKIGNEEWSPCGTMTQTSYEAVVNKYLAAIPSYWAGKLTTLMDGGSGGGWIGADVQGEVGKISGISLHKYAVSNWTTFDCPSVGFTAAQYYTKVNLAYGMESAVAGFETTMNQYDPTYTVGLMVDEWGCWSATLGTNNGTSYNQSTVREAVIAAQTLNTFNNHCKRVKMALVAQAVNVIQSLFLTSTNDNDSTLVKTPTFYTMRMMKVHQNAKMVPATMSSVTLQSQPEITASASVDSIGDLNITLVNINISNSDSITITLKNPPKPYQTITAQIVTGPTDSSYNDFGKAETVNNQPFAASNYTLSGTTLKVTLPAHSVVQFALSPTTATGIISPEYGHAVPQVALAPAAGGKIVIRYMACRATPLGLTLFGVDGRVIESASLTMEAGQQSLIWQPKNSSLGGRVYIVKITGAGSVKSQPIVLAR